MKRRLRLLIERVFAPLDGTAPMGWIPTLSVLVVHTSSGVHLARYAQTCIAEAGGQIRRRHLEALGESFSPRSLRPFNVIVLVPGTDDPTMLLSPMTRLSRSCHVLVLCLNEREMDRLSQALPHETTATTAAGFEALMTERVALERRRQTAVLMTRYFR